MAYQYQPRTASIHVVEVSKLIDLALMQDEVPQSVRERYLTLDKSSLDCIA